MAHLLRSSGRDYVVVERQHRVGSFFERFPRHRTLISINKRFTGRGEPDFNLRHDWHSLISDNSSLLFTRYSEDFFPHADDYLRYLDDYAEYTGVTPDILFGWEVDAVARVPPRQDAEADTAFLVTSTAGEHMRCTRVIVGTGYAKEAYPPDIKGIEELTVGYGDHSVDLSDYTNRSVLILGMGNTAFETAGHVLGEASFVHLISRTGAPRWAWETHYVGDLRAVNDAAVDTYLLKSLDVIGGGFPLTRDTIGFTAVRDQQTGRKLVCMAPPDREGVWDALDAGLVENTIEPGHSLGFADQLRTEHQSCFDYVIRCMGWKMDLDPFERGGLRIDMHGMHDDDAPDSSAAYGNGGTEDNPYRATVEAPQPKFPVTTAAYESVSEPGVFVIGALAHGSDYRRSAGGFIHGLRYVVRAAWRLLEQRFHGVSALGGQGDAAGSYLDWPGARDVKDATPAAVTAAILERVNVASGPYQMFGELGDLLVLPVGWFHGHGRDHSHGHGRDPSREPSPHEAPVFLEDVPLRGAEAMVPPDRGFITWDFEFQEGFHGHEKVIHHPIEHQFDPHQAHKSTLLHPIVRVYEPLRAAAADVVDGAAAGVGAMDAAGASGGGSARARELRARKQQLLSSRATVRKQHTLHLLEDLYTDFSNEIMYVRPLRNFLSDVQDGRAYTPQGAPIKREGRDRARRYGL